MLAIESLALQSRRRLQQHLHSLYFLPPFLPHSSPCEDEEVEVAVAREGSSSSSSSSSGLNRRRGGGGGGERERRRGGGAYSILLPSLQQQQLQQPSETSSSSSPPPSLPPSLLDNPDHRLTSDVDFFTTKLAEVIGKTLAVPALIIYCE